MSPRNSSFAPTLLVRVPRRAVLHTHTRHGSAGILVVAFDNAERRRFCGARVGPLDSQLARACHCAFERCDRIVLCFAQRSLIDACCRADGHCSPLFAGGHIVVCHGGRFIGATGAYARNDYYAAVDAVSGATLNLGRIMSPIVDVTGVLLCRAACLVMHYDTHSGGHELASLGAHGLTWFHDGVGIVRDTRDTFYSVRFDEVIKE